MDLRDAIEGFGQAIFHTIEDKRLRQIRAGMEAMTPTQRQALAATVELFRSWWVEQNQKVQGHTCGEQYSEEACPDPGYIQCLTCAGIFCEVCWVDHLHLTLEEHESAKK